MFENYEITDAYANMLNESSAPVFKPGVRLPKELVSEIFAQKRLKFPSDNMTITYAHDMPNLLQIWVNTEDEYAHHKMETLMIELATFAEEQGWNIEDEDYGTGQNVQNHFVLLVSDDFVIDNQNESSDQNSDKIIELLNQLIMALDDNELIEADNIAYEIQELNQGKNQWLDSLSSQVAELAQNPSARRHDSVFKYAERTLINLTNNK